MNSAVQTARIVTVARRIALGFASAALLLAASAAAVLAYPQPLFSYHVERGRLALYSDLPFDAHKAEALLDEVDRRISRSALDRGDGVHRIFVANAAWRARLTFLWTYGAGGVNFSPLTRNVFIRRSDVDANRVISSLGPVPPPRTLAYFAAHEIGHSLIAEHIGAVANWQLPVWVREGLADYIAFGGDVDIPALMRQFRAGERDLDPKRSGLYARYRLLVAHFLHSEGWTIDRLLTSGMPQSEAEMRLLAFQGN